MLAQQFNPCNMKYVIESLENALKPRKNETGEVIYGYALIDFRNETDDLIRLRTSIFPSENVPISIYIESE